MTPLTGHPGELGEGGARRRGGDATPAAPYGERARVHPGVHGCRDPELVAVELELLRHIHRHGQVAGREVGDVAHVLGQVDDLAPDRRLAQHPVLPRDLLPDLRPAERSAGAQGGDVEDAVVGLGVGHEKESAGEHPAVAHDDRVHVHRAHDLPIEAEVHAHRLQLRKRPGYAVDVREPADGLLEARRGVLDHLGVEPEPRHHEECVFAGHAVRAGDLGNAQVDRVGVTGEGGTDARIEIRQRQVEVAGEQVAGSRRQHGQGNAGAPERLRDGPHCAVATGRENHIGAASQGARRHSLARVILAGLEPHGLGPARRLGGRSDRLAKLLELNLHGVVDDRRAVLLPIPRVRHSANGTASAG